MAPQADPWSPAAEVMPELSSDAGLCVWCVCVCVAFDRITGREELRPLWAWVGVRLPIRFATRWETTYRLLREHVGCGRSVLAAREGR